MKLAEIKVGDTFSAPNMVGSKYRETHDQPEHICVHSYDSEGFYIPNSSRVIDLSTHLEDDYFLADRYGNPRMQWEL